LIPAPSGLTATAWHYFALFAAVIAALITEPLPGAAIGFIGVTVAAALLLVGKTPADATKWALSGFSNDAVWLIFAANMFALGYKPLVLAGASRCCWSRHWAAAPLVSVTPSRFPISFLLR